MLHVLGDALESHIHDDGAKKGTELARDARQLELGGIYDGQLVRLCLRKARGAHHGVGRAAPSLTSSVSGTPGSSSSKVPWKNSGLETDFVRIHWLSSSTHMAYA